MKISLILNKLILALSLLWLSACSTTLKQQELYILDTKLNKSLYYHTPTTLGGKFSKFKEDALLAPLENKQHSLYCITPEAYQYFRDEASGYTCKKSLK